VFDDDTLVIGGPGRFEEHDVGITGSGLTVPPGTSSLRVALNADVGVPNDFDLYLVHGDSDSPLTEYDCASRTALSLEYCEIRAPQPGRWTAWVDRFRDEPRWTDVATAASTSSTAASTSAAATASSSAASTPVANRYLALC
jgi:hypothetical protein